ncbi:hypothetical protein GCM10023262_02470 [Bartonella pachyuromydis]|uniref:Uncharacterized protein n=1 Tax=Bartonella pachyuromydis TaxID=931097 RepID=A0ABP8VBU2_9HYPH
MLIIKILRRTNEEQNNIFIILYCINDKILHNDNGYFYKKLFYRMHFQERLSYKKEIFSTSRQGIFKVLSFKTYS